MSSHNTEEDPQATPPLSPQNADVPENKQQSIFEELLIKDDANEPIISCPSPHDHDIIAEPIIISCVVCHINQISTTCFPCCHCALCDNCAYQLSKVSNVCPICRCGIKQIVKIYIVHK